MIDTYWSDHCRHTTFLTTIDNVGFDDYPEAQDAFIKYIQDRKKLGRTKPVNLMEEGRCGAGNICREQSDEGEHCGIREGLLR